MVLKMFKEGKLDAAAAMQLLAAQNERNTDDPDSRDRAPKRARSPSPDFIPSDDEPDDEGNAASDSTMMESLPNICSNCFSYQMCCV